MWFLPPYYNISIITSEGGEATVACGVLSGRRRSLFGSNDAIAPGDGAEQPARENPFDRRDGFERAEWAAGRFTADAPAPEKRMRTETCY